MAESKAVRRILKPAAKEEKTDGKKRVAAYCRVSTKSDGQETSYDTQVAVYTQKINDEPDWTMAGIYADFGMSGTQVQRRPRFLKMVTDCEDGKIDIILCKSISRFSRNTLDAVNYIRKLKDLGVRMIFEREGIDTGDGDLGDADHGSCCICAGGEPVHFRKREMGQAKAPPERRGTPDGDLRLPEERCRR